MQLTHRHADGGFYGFICEGSGKDDGDWVPGVIYRGTDGEVRWTSKQRWDERFTILEDPTTVSVTPVEFLGDDGGLIASYVVKVEDIADARLVTTRAADLATKHNMHHVNAVLRAHADSMIEGLHVRDIDFPDFMGDVNAFHAKYRQLPEHYDIAKILPADLHDFRHKFHNEETTEYGDEYEPLVAADSNSQHDEVVNRLATQLDSILDAVWVLLGTADLQFGKRITYAAWRRIVEKNMLKVLATEADADATDSGRDKKFDIVKPAGWEAPDHTDLVATYMRADGTICAPDLIGFNQDVAAE